MPKFNIQNSNSIEQNYSLGLLPQRNQKDFWYADSSARSNLANFSLSSENRRILRKTESFTFSTSSSLTPDPIIFSWNKKLDWGIPNNTIKYLFSHHIFNFFYTWYLDNKLCAYSVCYFSPTISHIAYVFYDPIYSHHDLPIRLTLQAIIDSHSQNLQYCYLGRFDPETKLGFYKRTLPNFEYFKDGNWVKY